MYFNQNVVSIYIKDNITQLVCHSVSLSPQWSLQQMSTKTNHKVPDQRCQISFMWEFDKLLPYEKKNNILNSYIQKQQRKQKLLKPKVRYLAKMLFAFCFELQFMVFML